MSKIKDLTGKKFGKLVVMKLTDRPENRKKCSSYWICKCECGNEVVANASDLKCGKKTSCGCLRWTGDARRTHGRTGSREYQIHNNMKRRCNDPKSKSYKNYGERGIKYCEEWETFEGFWADMQECYEEHLTLDRIDVNKNYYKENCRWVTREVQCNNKTNNHLYEFEGGQYTSMEIANMVGMDKGLMHSRISRGLSIEEAIKPKHELEIMTYRGETKTVVDFAKEYGMTYHQLKKRLMRGWSIEKALTQPLRKR